MKLLVALLAVAACGDRERPHAQGEAAKQAPRVIDPAPQSVRALPPHAIRADGVGPYKLGLTLEHLGTQIPSGGRSAQVEIDNVVHLSVLHAEEDAILIGGEPLGRATFVAVVSAQIARTESGVQVGSTRDELTHALGAPVVDLDRARDPRIVVPSNLRELRAVMSGDRVAGLVLSASDTPTKPDGCVRPAPTDDKKIGACVTGAPDFASIENDELVVRAADTDKVVVKVALPNAVFIGAIRADGGRDELIAVVRMEDAAEKSWWLVGYRWDGAHLVRSLDRERWPLYQLTATNARWIGSPLADLDLALEVQSRGETFEVGGLLTRRSGDKLRDLLVLSPVQVPRKRAKPATADVPASGSSNAGVGSAAASVGSDDAHPP